MRRTFVLGSGASRKVVRIEVLGTRVAVVESTPGGGTKRGERPLASEAQAQAASRKMADELIARGFVENVAPAPAPTVAAPASDGLDLGELFEGEEEPVGELLPRLQGPRVAEADAAPKQKTKKKKRKKRGQAEGSSDSLDKRVVAVFFAGGVGLLALLGSFLFGDLLRPPSLLGNWAGSKLDYEIGHAIVHTQYALRLDESKRATMTLEGALTMSGTYTVRGDRLELALRDEEGDAFETGYKFVLGRSTLDLYDAESGKKVVQLIRQSGKPTAGSAAPPPPEAPQALANAPAGGGNNADDAKLASVAFEPKDGAFRLRHPPGWKPETGSRPDNTYSWARFTRDSAKIQVFADVTGSLMSGSDFAGQHEEGSEFAPVHTAHELYKEKAAEEFSDYSESEPALFQGSSLGEGRVAAFTASAGGLFGGKLRGYRVTFLTNNRRITVLCSCPEDDFKKLEPTFLAVCRSLAH